MKYLILALSLIAACSSHDECNNVGDTKCQDNKVWICNKSSKWDMTDDCKELSTMNNVELVCIPPGPDGPAACLPPVSIDDAESPDAELDGGADDASDCADVNDGGIQ